MIIYFQDSLESKTTSVKHNSASLCNIVKKNWFINDAQEQA